MSLKAGIVGLPNVGKSTLFNAITKIHILAANYPFATIEPNVGVVTVPDKRLDFLNELYHPKSLVPATVEFTDIAGLVKGASKGEGLGNKFLSHIREVDAIINVVRCFEDENITHVEGNIDPIRDVEIIDVELILADLEVIENRIAKLGKKMSMAKSKEEILEVNTLNKCKDALTNGKLLRKCEFNDDELKLLKAFNLITLKPVLFVANVNEDAILSSGNKYTEVLKEYAEKEDASVIIMCCEMESELSGLENEEKNALMLELGLQTSGLDRLIIESYNILGLRTFFTAGSDEVKAWTFKEGQTAPNCAGIIHTDFERGFIRAEVMSYEDLEKYKSEIKVKEAGKIRLEGKNYIMQDGDICYFRFNV